MTVNEESLRTLVDAINDGFLLIQPDGQITYANRQAAMLLRKPPEELVAASIWTLMPDDPAQPHRREIERALRDQVVTEFDLFYPNLYSWQEVRAVPLPTGLGLILRDITDRQWLLRREAERAYLRAVFNTAPVAISLVRGPHHRIEFLNILAQQILGNRPTEGRTVKEAFPEIVEQGFLEILNNVYQTGEPFYAENMLCRIDQRGTGELEDIYFTFTYQALRGFDAKIDGVLGIGIQVTPPAP